jgi:hypothetical protein
MLIVNADLSQCILKVAFESRPTKLRVTNAW